MEEDCRETNATVQQRAAKHEISVVSITQPRFDPTAAIPMPAFYISSCDSMGNVEGGNEQAYPALARSESY